VTDEQFLILNFLRSSPENYFARREIARRAVRRKVYDENHHWADAPLSLLLTEGLIEQNAAGLYRMKQQNSSGQASGSTLPRGRP
jgi:hypothetical protein